MFRPGLVGGGYGFGGRRRQRGGMDLYMVMLLSQLLNQIYQLERKPPVTLAMMAACFATFFDTWLPKEFTRLLPSVNQACLQPYMIFQNRQWGRLIWSAFLHADEYHLYWNMSSLLWKGVQLEFLYGPVAFAALMCELLLLSHGLVVAGTALLAHYVPEYSYLYLTNCSIGISALLFALKIVLNHNAPGFSNVFGFTLPTKYMAWAELLLASMFNPRASFMGHLAGIAAGLIHVRLAPAAADGLRWLRRAQVQARVRFNPGQAHFAARPADATPAPAPAPAAAAAAAGVRAAPRPTAAARGNPAAAATPAAAGAPHAAAGSASGGTARFARAGGPQQREDQVVEATSRQAEPLSAEELRQRRLQRFGGQS